MLERAGKLAHYAFMSNPFACCVVPCDDAVAEIWHAQNRRHGLLASSTRWMATKASATSLNMSVMPRSFVRVPKSAPDELTDAMKLHVVGLIFYGNPDVTHLFPAAPHLAGSGDVSCACFLRIVKHQFNGQTGMLPMLHVQACVHLASYKIYMCIA
eukprot:3995973-Pleurochrysis_carterae.AAC.1